MFGTSFLGILEDIGYGARNSISDVCRSITSLPNKSNESIDEEEDEQHLKTLPLKFIVIHSFRIGGKNTERAKRLKKDPKEVLMEMYDHHTEIGKEVKRLRSISKDIGMDSSEFEKTIADDIYYVLTDLVDSKYADEFMRLHAQLDTSKAQEGTIDYDMLSDKLNINGELLKLITELKDGKVTEQEFFEKLKDVDTIVSFNIKDFIEQKYQDEKKTDTTDTEPDNKEDSKKPDKKESMDLKSLLMETEIGQKLFEHV